jgi:hypothetical protein
VSEKVKIEMLVDSVVESPFPGLETAPFTLCANLIFPW